MIAACFLTILNGFYNVYVEKNYNPSTWYLPLRVSLPFDESSFVGHLVAIIIQPIIGLMFLAVMCALVTYFVGCNFYIEAVLMQLKDKILDIDDHIKQNAKKNNKPFHERKVNRMYENAISFHIKIYEYVHQFLSKSKFFKTIPN